MTGVGPQDDWDEDKQPQFFIALETEVFKAQKAGKSVIIEIDSNSKLDANTISPNGKMLALVINNPSLIVANSLSICKGLMSRQRIKDRTEEICIEVLLLSSDLQPFFTSLLIDEKRIYELTKIRNTKNGAVKKKVTIMCY